MLLKPDNPRLFKNFSFNMEAKPKIPHEFQCIIFYGLNMHAYQADN